MTVKAGQVWQNKNSGSRWEVDPAPTDEARWVILRSGEKTKTIPDWLLVDDYVLVKDAP